MRRSRSLLADAAKILFGGPPGHGGHPKVSFGEPAAAMLPTPPPYHHAASIWVRPWRCRKPFTAAAAIWPGGADRHRLAPVGLHRAANQPSPFDTGSGKAPPQGKIPDSPAVKKKALHLSTPSLENSTTGTGKINPGHPSETDAPGPFCTGNPKHIWLTLNHQHAHPSSTTGRAAAAAKLDAHTVTTFLNQIVSEHRSSPPPPSNRNRGRHQSSPRQPWIFSSAGITPRNILHTMLNTTCEHSRT